jgi:hypothetical protein
VSRLDFIIPRIFQEFHCSNCGAFKAFRSRTRNTGERLYLHILMLKPARCEGCLRRVYVFRSVPVLEPAAVPGRIGPPSRRDHDTETRVA